MAEVVEFESLIRACLANRQLTTAELTKALPSALRDCPDELMRELTKMRKKGIVSARFSAHEGGFVWTLV